MDRHIEIRSDFGRCIAFVQQLQRFIEMPQCQ